MMLVLAKDGSVAEFKPYENKKSDNPIGDLFGDLMDTCKAFRETHPDSLEFVADVEMKICEMFAKHAKPRSQF